MMRFAIVVAFAACGSKSSPSPAPNPELVCTADDDCVAVRKSCCSCSMGGDVEIINRKAAATRTMENACKVEDVNCPAVISETPGCTGTPACRAGRCVAVPRPEGK